jgi:hypothetical protein
MSNRIEKKNFKTRLRSMLKLDFYRLFHTPVFCIMLCISAIIPAMLLTMSGQDLAVNPNLPDERSALVGQALDVGRDLVVSGQTGREYTNTWELIESTGGSAAGANPLDFGGYANINMVFIFAGLLMAIFIAHDYISGFVKHIFTVHSKKTDYVISKLAIGVFSGAGMIIAYLFGAIIAGVITGKSFDVNVGGLLLCVISKMFLMGVFCSLFLAVSVFFRNRLWLTIIFTFLLGMMFYPAASIATLNSTVTTTLITLIAGVIGAVAIGSVSTFILNHRDLT